MTDQLITIDQLKQIMPNAKTSRCMQNLPYIHQALVEFEINTPQRISAFISQIAHESVEMRYFEEIASGADYEGRRDLGNTQPGDGVRFKGRGPIQLTGRTNYIRVGKALGIDLVNNPKRAKDMDVCWRIAGQFWKDHDLNQFADHYAFDVITYRVNGGYNGKKEREEFYERALKAFGLEIQR